MANWRRKSDGAVFTEEAVRSSHGGRFSLFEELDAGGNIRDPLPPATRPAPPKLAPIRPTPARMSRDQLLVEVGRALHEAFGPDRADVLLEELQTRLVSRIVVQRTYNASNAIIEYADGKWTVRGLVNAQVDSIHRVDAMLSLRAVEDP
jgi:hypothetical protein